MLTSGKFDTARGSISLDSLGDKVTLVLSGDYHRDAEHFSERHWSDFHKFNKSLGLQRHIIMGDLFDFGSTSERAAFQRTALHADSWRRITKDCLRSVDEMVAELWYMKDWILAILEGNHNMLIKIDNPRGKGQIEIGMTELVAEKLGVPCVGVAGLIRLDIECHGSRTSVDIFAHHMGRGGGATKGGSVNGIYKMLEVMEADIYAGAHNHDKGVWTDTRLHVDKDMRVREKEVLLFRTGSFTRTWEPGTKNYNVDACRPPSSLGWVYAELEVRRDRSEGGRGFHVQMTGCVH